MSPSRRTNFLRPLLAAALLSLAPSVFMGGCAGGTSSTAENPGLMIGFRMNGQSTAFEGHVLVFATDSNPTFFAYPPLETSGYKPELDIVIGGGETGNGLRFLGSRKAHYIPGDFLAGAAGYIISLPIIPPTVEGDRFGYRAVPGTQELSADRPFNLVFTDHEGNTGFVEGIAVDAASGKYRGPDGSLADTLWVDLGKPGSVTGTLDTAGGVEAPLLVFAPGLPYAARVHGNRFRFYDVPKSRLAVRLLDSTGGIFSIPDTLDFTRIGEGGADDTLPILKPGPRMDTVELPDAIPVLDAPTASPEGPHQFTDSVKVILSAGEGESVYYTLDGTTPGLYSSRYTAPLVLRASATLKAMASRKDFHPSPVSAHTYLLVPAAPKADPASQAFRDSLLIKLTTVAKGGTIRYTTDGSNPVAGSPAYTAPIKVTETTILKAVTSVPGLGLSQITEERYILVPDTLQSE